MLYEGSCHCGTIGIRLTLVSLPQDTAVRACDCSFCRAHGARTVADPQGRVDIGYRAEGPMRRYRFGLRTADFLVCGDCGVYTAAVADTDNGLRATVNVNALRDRDKFDERPPRVSYDDETAGQRLARRAVRWTPALLYVLA
jgi:hypothetical protein